MRRLSRFDRARGVGSFRCNDREGGVGEGAQRWRLAPQRLRFGSYIAVRHWGFVLNRPRQGLFDRLEHAVGILVPGGFLRAQIL